MACPADRNMYIYYFQLKEDQQRKVKSNLDDWNQEESEKLTSNSDALFEVQNQILCPYTLPAFQLNKVDSVFTHQSPPSVCGLRIIAFL